MFVWCSVVNAKIGNCFWLKANRGQSMYIFNLVESSWQKREHEFMFPADNLQLLFYQDKLPLKSAVNLVHSTGKAKMKIICHFFSDELISESLAEVVEGWKNWEGQIQILICARSFGKIIFVSNYTAPSNRVEQGTNREILSCYREKSNAYRMTLLSSQKFPACSLFYPVWRCSIGQNLGEQIDPFAPPPAPSLVRPALTWDWESITDQIHLSIFQNHSVRYLLSPCSACSQALPQTDKVFVEWLLGRL